MITLNMAAPVLDLDLKPVMEQGADGKATEKETSLARFLANALISSQKGDAIKYLDWAISLNGKGEIQVDDSDFSSLRTFVLENQMYTNLVKAQILRRMDSQRELTK
jgi:hypothetical protein